MPIYEYECQACGNQHEALQKMSASPLLECPVCHLPKLKKKISSTDFRLKGNGWYETDFKGGNRKREVKPEVKKEAKKEMSPAKTKA